MPLSSWISKQLAGGNGQESGFRELCEHVPVGIFLADLKDQCVYANPAACAIVGVAAGEAFEYGWMRYLHPDDVKRAFASWEAAVAAQSDFFIECRYQLPQRGLVWTRSHAVPWRNAAGEVIGFLGSIQDITEWKLAEHRLRESEERFRSLCEHAPVGIFLASAQGETVYVNARCSEIIGLPAEATLGDGWSAGLHPEDRLRVPALWRKAVDCQTPYENESRYVAADGSVRHVFVTAIPNCNPQGDVASWIGVMLDITQQKRAIEALRASEEQYRELFNATTDAIIFCSLDGRLVDVNPAACKMHGYTREEFLQLDVDDFIHPDSHPLFSEYLDTCRRGELFHCEVQNIRKDGTAVDIEVHGTRLVYRGELHAFAIVRDIGPRKAAEAEMRRQETLLAHVSRLSTMGEMVASIAHEVNQPLYSIVNYAKATTNVLADQTAAELDEVRAWNEEISAAATRAGDIVRRLRDFTRRSPATRQAADVNTLVRESLALVQHELRRADVQVELELGDDLPQLLVDHVQIQQVLVNLLKNAIEAFDGRPAAGRQVRIATAAAAGAVRVAIADNGPGLAAVGGSPFDPFVTSKPEGMGLGLTISRTIALAHGGTIVASNHSTGGATFTFSLPAACLPA